MPQLGDCTNHARVRMQQRGISEDALDFLLDYGRPAHVQGGCVVVHMDRKAQRKAMRQCGRQVAKTLDRVSGLFAVLGRDGLVVTVGHRCRRIPRD